MLNRVHAEMCRQSSNLRDILYFVYKIQCVWKDTGVRESRKIICNQSNILFSKSDLEANVCVFCINQELVYMV